jgi:hypothetical protein
MFRSKLAARTVSVGTALRCLDRVSEARGLTSIGAGSDDVGLEQNVISVDELIRLARKRGIKIRTKAVGWSRLLSETAFTDVLLRLKNRNVVLALRNKEANPKQIVVSDPLYEGGKPFFLPADALSKVWAGEALIVEPRQSNAERTVTYLLWVLPVVGFVAAGFFLVRALHQALGS